MSKQKHESSGGGCLFWIVLIVVGLYFGARAGVRYFTTRPLAAHLSEYVAIPGLREGTQGAYIAGKIVAVNKKESRIDDVYFELPKDVRAATPEEVETIVWLECDDKLVGTYTDGAKGYRIVCQTTLIDKTGPAIVDRRTFVGSDPPGSKSSSGDRSGDRPNAEIAEYLVTLPKREEKVAAAAAAEAKQALIKTGASWPVVFSDSFSADNGSWLTGSEDNEFAMNSRLVADGTYRWDLKAHRDVHFLQTAQIAPVSDFYFSVQARQVSGATGSAYGAVFRADGRNNHYSFLVKDDGYFVVLLAYGGEWTPLVDWTDSPAIQPGGVNQLAVSAEGPHFLFSINGQVVGEANDDRLSSGTVGMVVELYNAEDTGLFEFDDVELRTP